MLFICSLRCQSEFETLFECVNRFIGDHDLEPITVPRQRRPPARITGNHGNANAYEATTVSAHYCPHFYEAIDTAVSGLKERFSDSRGLKAYGKLEHILLCGVVVDAEQYPEIDTADLQLELSRFRRKYTIMKVNDAVEIFHGMVPEVRAIYQQVETLIRLLLVCPASSAEAERSFSGLRRLKTWLRSTMTECRLNSVCVCHTHQYLLDSIDVQAVLADFSSRSDVRQKLFGRI